MLERRHIRRRMEFVINFTIFVFIVPPKARFRHSLAIASMEYLVQAVPAWQYLERVREEHKDDDGELTDSDKQGRRRIHADDVRSDLHISANDIRRH
jgi:hypothetical protein